MAFFLVAIACLHSPATCWAKPSLEQVLQRHVTVAWQGQTFSTVLSRISETQQLAYWLDRRVDPQQTVEASFTDLPLQHVLEQLAEKHSVGIRVLDNLIYVGPAQSAHELPALLKRAQDALALAPSSARHRWLDKKPTTWPRLSQPRNLLTGMMEQAEVKFQGGEKIAHDLWDAKSLPRLALVDRTVLILIGFDLTCQISADGDTCQVVPIERPLLQGQQPRISKRPSKKTSAPKNPTQKRFSLQLKNQAVGGVIDQLARQLKLQIQWNQESLDQANRSKRTLISCNLKDVPLDELLSGILTPAGLKFEKDGEKIKITSAP